MMHNKADCDANVCFRLSYITIWSYIYYKSFLLPQNDKQHDKQHV